MPKRPSDPPPSPCQRACGFKDGHCRNCFRTPEEVQAWRSMTPAEKRAVLVKVKARQSSARP